MKLRPYADTEADAAAWDALCRQSHCASLLHTRSFLSYHGTRFIDRSLVLLDGERWLGVLPAAQHPMHADCVESHPGITYGGFVHGGALRGESAIEALRLAADHYAGLGYRRLRYKPLPHIYQSAPAQDDLYALFRVGAQRVRCDLSCALDLAHPLARSARRQRGIAKAGRADHAYATGSVYAPALWAVLEDNLQRRHGAAPVHDLAQIAALAQRFPQHIRFDVALRGGDVIAGTVAFIVGPVLHLQYIAASEAGHAQAALDGLFDHLIGRARAAGHRYVDFGTSNEDEGRVLNEGLYRFKSEFGAGGVACESYELELAR